MNPKDKMITARDLAEKLDLSVETIWRYTRNNKIPYYKVGTRQYRYKLSEVIQVLNKSKVKEEKSKYVTRKDKEYTYQDYLKLPEEPGYQLEVLEGRLVQEPSPGVMHQRVSRRLQRMLEDYFAKYDPEGEIFDAPLDITLTETTVVQPDLLYISGEQKEIIKEKRIDGSPLLIVEIISPYSSKKDRIQKMKIYLKAQVKHYWLVDPEKTTFECFALQNNTCALITAGLEKDLIEHPDFKELTIPLEELWPESL